MKRPDAGLLDGGHEPRFDRLTRLVQDVFDVPISLITMIPADRKAPMMSSALPEARPALREAPLCHSFAQHAAQQKTMLVTHDDAHSRKHFANPAPCFAAHMGVPIHLEGHVIGALCAIDREPRYWSAQDIAQLKSFAALVDDEIDLGERIRKSQRETAESSALQVQALQASQQKTDFIDAMTHEVAGPLTAILGYTDLILEASTTPRQDLYLKNVQTAAERISGLMDDSLDLSRTEAGALSVDKAPFRLVTLLDDAKSIVRLSALEKGIDLHIEVDPSLRETVRGDEPRLHQVLLNLLANAIKFTAEGSVTLRVTRDITDRDAVRFEVTDTGVGIDVKNQTRIFDSGAQATAAVQGEFGGSGLGLSISEALVKRMDGTIGVHSDPDHGAAFWFTVTLPIFSEAGKPAA